MASKMFDNIRWLIPASDKTLQCGEESEIVVSSRIRIARNLDNVPFELKMKQSDAENLIGLIRSIVDNKIPGEFLNLRDLKPLERESLLECHLVSPGFITKEKPTSVFINEGGNVSVMINEEDHLRFQGIGCGLNFVNLSSEVFRVEEYIGDNVNYAYSDGYGFLTSCPTNIGTGMRASVFMHLPGLVFTNEVEKVLKGALQIGMTVRGIYGEGSEIRGSLFQISNQHTIGFKEEDLLERITKLARMIIDIEKKARDVILTKARSEFEDKIYRSLAILRAARTINSTEVLNLLSALRFGVGVGMVKETTLQILNEIMVVSRPANIQLYFGELLEEQERDIKRAEYIRKKLGAE
ncbi:MAG: protein arginine kinase [candidate division WOR-3 bacterium]|nr:MAG: protein arginine kinase [candidate division WOR-3 bacterium]